MKGHRRKEMHVDFLVSVGNKLTHLGGPHFVLTEQRVKDISS